MSFRSCSRRMREAYAVKNGGKLATYAEVLSAINVGQ